MANPIPCVNCLEVPDADFLVTNRLDMPWPFDQSTVGLCTTCLIGAAAAMAEALAAVFGTAPEPEGPGVLEQVEAEEGPVKVASASSKSRRSKESDPVAVAVGPEAAEEVPTPDDLG